MTDRDRSLDDLGPVDYLVVEFPAGASNFTGEMAAELLALVDSGTIRVIDALILTKDKDGTVLVLGEDQYVDHADRSGVDQREQLCGHLAGEVARSRWELDDEVVDGAELIEGCVCHRASFLGRLGCAATGAPSRRAGAPRA